LHIRFYGGDCESHIHIISMPLVINNCHLIVPWGDSEFQPASGTGHKKAAPVGRRAQFYR